MVEELDTAYKQKGKKSITTLRNNSGIALECIS